MSYELYNFLSNQVKEKNYQNINIEEMCLTFNGLSNLSQDDQQSHYEELYGLIIHYEALSNNGVLLTIPFEGKIMPGGKKEKNLVFNTNKLPLELKQILYEYILYYNID